MLLNSLFAFKLTIFIFFVMTFRASGISDLEISNEECKPKNISLVRKSSNLLKDELPACYDVRGIIKNPETEFPVYNQGRLNTCSANAVAAAIQFERIKNGLQNYITSRLFIHYCARPPYRRYAKYGANISGCIRAISEYGVCDERLWPYSDDGIQAGKRPPAKCYQIAKREMANFSLLLSYPVQKLDTLKLILVRNIPIIASIRLYESFKGRGATTGIVTLPNIQTEKPLRKHAVLIVGYSDLNKTFTVRNSWGINRGDKGYYYLPYDYILDKKLTNYLACLILESR